MTISVSRNAQQPGVITISAGKNESTPAVEVRGFDRLSVQVVRTGATQTGNIEGSNDGVSWFQLHSTELAAAGGNESLSALPDAGGHNLKDVLEHPRYIRLVVTNTVGGDTDQITATFNGF